MNEIIRVGTSAGGARAKAVVAWNERTDDFLSGQVSAGKVMTIGWSSSTGYLKTETKRTMICRSIRGSSMPTI